MPRPRRVALRSGAGPSVVGSPFWTPVLAAQAAPGSPALGEPRKREEAGGRPACPEPTLTTPPLSPAARGLRVQAAHPHGQCDRPTRKRPGASRSDGGAGTGSLHQTTLCRHPPPHSPPTPPHRQEGQASDGSRTQARGAGGRVPGRDSGPGGRPGEPSAATAATWACHSLTPAWGQCGL